MLKNTRSLIRLAALAGTAMIALTGTVQAQDSDMLELSVALGVVDANFNPTTASVFLLAVDQGYFERHGVNVTYIKLDGTPQAAAALYSGAVDLADISIDSAIRLRAENNVPVRGIVASSIGNSFLIASQVDIETVEDLVGRTYAISDYDGLDHALTRAVLRGYGMDPEAPDYVAIGAPDVRVQALAAGQVDATTVSFGTYSSLDGREEIHVLVAPDDFSARSPSMTKFVVGLESTIEEKNEAIQRFTDAMIEASRAFQADPAGWVNAAAAARPELSRESLERTADLNDARWCINGCMNPDKLAESIDFIYANPDFASVPVITYEDIVDLEFTTRALEDMGPVGGTGLDARE